MKTRITIGIVAMIILIVGIVAVNDTEPVFAYEATLYKSASCGCCGVYAQHAQDTIAVDSQNTVNMNAIKEEYSIPAHLQSCHTTIVEGYFIEGHIPMQAVEKLLTEKPDIAGIALPGMPSGTPGMPGPKTQDWVITAVHHDGSTSEFMRI